MQYRQTHRVEEWTSARRDDYYNKNVTRQNNICSELFSDGINGRKCVYAMDYNLRDRAKIFLLQGPNIVLCITSSDDRLNE